MSWSTERFISEACLRKLQATAAAVADDDDDDDADS